MCVNPETRESSFSKKKNERPQLRWNEKKFRRKFGQDIGFFLEAIKDGCVCLSFCGV